MNPQSIIKNCEVHGDVLHELNKVVGDKKYYKCKPCKNMRKSDIRKDNKYFLMEYMGGECQICGYNKCLSGLEVHHVDPAGKTLEFSRIGRDNNQQKYKDEINNTPCILLCANCHREVHEGLVLILPKI
jgi:5-methylcytosine-specific restriction endonuclease McrA